MRIRECRVKAGITQAALARAAGVTETCVWMWEHDRITPTTKRLKVIAETLGVSVDELL